MFSTASAPHSWEGWGCWGSAAQPLGTPLHSQIPNVGCSTSLHCRAGWALSGADLAGAVPHQTFGTVWSLAGSSAHQALKPWLSCFTDDEKGVDHGGILYHFIHSYTKMTVPLSDRDFWV